VSKAKAPLIIVFILSIASVSNALSIVYVDVNGPNDPGTGTFDDPFRRIQDAIDDANDDDIIEIQPGLYSGSGNYDLDPNGKSITIRSLNPEDPNIVANTIIDPNKAGRGFYFHGGEDMNCIVAGLTIKNAYAFPVIGGYNGGGIYCYNSSPTIRNCTIKSGHATGSGGGLFCDLGKLRIINCIITGNLADYYGGGISCVQSNVKIIRCIISDNIATLEGGGLDAGQSNPMVVNCIITDNEASYGGGINCFSYEPNEASLINCIVNKNSATNFGGALSCQYNSSAAIENCILWANQAGHGAQLTLLYGGIASVSYSNVENGQMQIYDPCESLVWGNGNIDADPCFAFFDANGDPNLWDFHLQSAYGRWEPNSQEWVTDSNMSLCIDAGDPNSDWNGEPWPNGKRINMGAFGGTYEASMNGNIADFNVSGAANFVDFAGFADKWFAEEFCIEDLTNNGMVDFVDLRVFAENWLWQRE
jgi:hypothetical protein